MNYEEREFLLDRALAKLERGESIDEVTHRTITIQVNRDLLSLQRDIRSEPVGYNVEPVHMDDTSLAQPAQSSVARALGHGALRQAEEKPEGEK